MNVALLLDEFHRRPGADCTQPPEPPVDVPGALDRVAYIEEEVRELREAVEAGDLVKAADALADLVYVVYGTAWRMGIPLDAVVAEVHRSNMTKTPTPGDGKAIKGPGYSPPDIARALRVGECTGIAARWCPVHGDCACVEWRDLNDPYCPLHAAWSSHWEAVPSA